MIENFDSAKGAWLKDGWWKDEMSCWLNKKCEFEEEEAAEAAESGGTE